MRYLMIVLGLFGILFGGYVILAGPAMARPSGEFFALVGALFLALGLATVDIVEALKARQP